ncbi:unnamed protein product [Adineta steineri]|uniref:Small acidic protein n=1 Tax=Adineta steineri TaxID=433720 RepID=A0A818KJU4_9BILA|nr:unnamed protein product [Adineta steineri]CAF3561644.1 unnamed protein product [Adineta steineri]
MSTAESKKKSSSKSSKKSHQDDENTDEIPVEEVHTANNWESADLGDSQRKQKFLRLMGAKKRKDESEMERQESRDSNPDEDVSPEKKHCRSKVETETINRELERQFNESLQAKITHAHHEGLGFHDGSFKNSGASSSTDWKHQSTKLAFVPAKTEVGASMDHVVVENVEKEEEKTEKQEEKSSDKHEKKKKRKS